MTRSGRLFMVKPSRSLTEMVIGCFTFPSMVNLSVGVNLLCALTKRVIAVKKKQIMILIYFPEWLILFFPMRSTRRQEKKNVPGEIFFRQFSPLLRCVFRSGNKRQWVCHLHPSTGLLLNHPAACACRRYGNYFVLLYF